MYIDKAEIVATLRSRGLQDRADWVDRELPRIIDTHKNGALLRTLALRLMGKRLTGPYFLDHVDEGLHACDYTAWGGPFFTGGSGDNLLGTCGGVSRGPGGRTALANWSTRISQLTP